MENYTKKQLEELTKKCIVVTPSGIYKLTNLIEENNNCAEGNYIAEFSKLRDGKETEEKEKFSVSSNFKISFFEFEGIKELSFLDTLYSNSYADEDDCSDTFYLKVEQKNTNMSKENIAPFVEEFFINYAKMQQNDLNRKRIESLPKKHEVNINLVKYISKIYKTSFRILSEQKQK